MRQPGRAASPVGSHPPRGRRRRIHRSPARPSSVRTPSGGRARCRPARCRTAPGHRCGGAPPVPSPPMRRSTRALLRSASRLDGSGAHTSSNFIWTSGPGSSWVATAPSGVSRWCRRRRWSETRRRRRAASAWREHLVAARVGQHQLVPAGRSDAPGSATVIRTWAQHQVVRALPSTISPAVAAGRSERCEVMGHQRSDRPLRRHRHEDRRAERLPWMWRRCRCERSRRSR